MASKALTFKLSEDFISRVASWADPFEGNPLGKFVYDRTYSRYKDDDSLETWTDTCRRVVEGCYTLQKEHIEKHSLGWDDEQGQRSAQEMFERLYNHKFLASGRAMWCLGTPVVHNKELDMALFNCSFISTKDIKTTHSRPFRFLMDVSMLGCGCGFDTKGSNTLKLYTPIFPPNQAGLITHTVEDTREGWVDALGTLIDAYATPFHAEITFDYSLIRPEGQRLKTFGGKSSGAKPLKDLLEGVRKVLDTDIEKNNGLLSTRGIVDIMNMIGVCVVAGEYIA